MITVLCVDDEVDFRRLLVEEFTDVVLAALEASNGKEGLDLNLGSWPDIVVCDISMPVMNGHELLAEIQINHPEFSHTPFIMLTALSDKENQLAGLSAGAEDYLTKPVDLELLMAKINGCIMRLQSKRRTGHGL